MDPTQINNVQARLAVLNSHLHQPEVNPFLYGGLALEFVTAHEERVAQAALRGLPLVVRSSIRMESGTGFARLMAATYQCSSDLKAAVQLLLQQRAPDGLDWDSLLAIERQCNLWTRDAFYVMTGVRLYGDSPLLQSDVVTKTLERRRRSQAAVAAAAGRGRGLHPPAPAPKGWGPYLSAPAPASRTLFQHPSAPEQMGRCQNPSALAPRGWQPPPSAPAPPLTGWHPPPSASAPAPRGGCLSAPASTDECPLAPRGTCCTGYCDSRAPRTLNM